MIVCPPPDPSPPLQVLDAMAAPGFLLQVVTLQLGILTPTPGSDPNL